HPAPPERIAVVDEVGRILHARLSGPSVLDLPLVRTVAYLAPIVFATGAFAAALLALVRAGTVSDTRGRRILWRGLIATAGIEVLRFPLMTIDFWLSLAWGRMAAAGANPYYQLAPVETLHGLPLDAIKIYMTYGPLWTALTAVIAMFVESTV